MPTSIMDRVAAAKAAVPSITPAEANAMREREDVMILDVRDPNEVAATGIQQLAARFHGGQHPGVEQPDGLRGRGQDGANMITLRQQIGQGRFAVQAGDAVNLFG